LCIVGVIAIALSNPAETTTKTTTPGPVAQSTTSTTPGGGGTPPPAKAQPQATSTTTDKSSTALSVLSTIASAAVGGIAGMLRLAPTGLGRKEEDPPDPK
jgi:hypothetical protein